MVKRDLFLKMKEYPILRIIISGSGNFVPGKDRRPRTPEDMTIGIAKPRHQLSLP